jgi:hypothetical protein
MDTPKSEVFFGVVYPSQDNLIPDITTALKRKDISSHITHKLLPRKIVTITCQRMRNSNLNPFQICSKENIERATPFH